MLLKSVHLTISLNEDNGPHFFVVDIDGDRHQIDVDEQFVGSDMPIVFEQDRDRKGCSVWTNNGLHILT